jgi:exodeoxyribonuclease V beta subunit
VSAPAPDPTPFDLCGPLPQGVTVLEASAGTGKTFTIAALAARYVAEGIGLERLLLVTFTRMATGELRERVRERLVETERQLSRVLAGAAPTGDDAVVALLAGGPLEEVRRRRDRLSEAVSDFDAATIATTHGFCLEVLGELGTLGDLEPDFTFTETVDDLREEVVDDLYVAGFYAHGQTDFDRYEAGSIAKLAIDHPTATLHPAADESRERPRRRREFAVRAREELAARKRRLAVMGYDDLLTRLRGALYGPNGEAAAARLRERYEVVLIDEFQDTDPVQWDIVSRAFGSPPTTLVLIADPKQAIYAFRGADVYAYLDALGAARTRNTLTVNHRSDQRLIDGFDALFGTARLGHERIVYRQVRATDAHLRPRLIGAPVGAALRLRLVDRRYGEVVTTARGWAQIDSAREHVARDVAQDIVALLASGARIEQRRDDGSTLRTVTVAPGHVAVLVPFHKNAALVQEHLEAVGVPAVINGAGSVFDTEAAEDWLTLLAALERPAYPPRARSAALTPFLGWSAARVAAAGEDELEELHQRLHAWARVLRTRGVAALTETVLLGEGVPARLLATLEGERHLTDLGHVASLLHHAASADGLGVAALAGWLRARRDAAGEEGSDEMTRRLESDADAVQVLTIHRSKGLEFPIVHCPFLWEPGPKLDGNFPVYFHDADADGGRAVDVALEGSEYRRHKARYVSERRGEDLRLAYVALTRARHQATVWWADTFRSGETSIARLLFGRDEEGQIAEQVEPPLDDGVAFARVQQIAAAAPEAVSVEWSRLPSPELRWAAPAAEPETLSVARFERSLDRAWRRTSYSALTAAAHEAWVSSEPEQPALGDEPAGPVPVEAGGLGAGDDRPEVPLSAMAAGTAIGTLVHETLEAVDFTAPDLEAEVAGVLRAARARSGVELGCDLETAAAGLALALRTPLGGSLEGVPLAGVDSPDRLDELAFELPLAGGDRPRGRVELADLAALLAERLPAEDPLAGYPARLADPQLAAQLSGYLTGSIDLVVRRVVTGVPRFSVIDYKTNWLGGLDEPLTAWHYRHEVLAAEMQRAHYALQALLYAVALHRYLRWRLVGYDPALHLGGVHYLFLRGMLGPEGPLVGGRRPGVFSWQPPAGLVAAVSGRLEGRE